MPSRRACACGLRTNATCTISGKSMSSTNRARPVSRRGSSLRLIRSPTACVVIASTLQNSAPELHRIGRQVRQELLHFRDQLVPAFPAQEPQDVPGILRPPCMELHKDEIGGSYHRQVSLLSRSKRRPIQNLPLPLEFAHDDIDVAFAGHLETDNASERVRQIPLPDIDDNASALQGRPEIKP